MISKSWILLLGVGISFAALVSASEEKQLSENFASARVIRRDEPGKKKKEKKNINKKKKEKMNMNKKKVKKSRINKRNNKKGTRRTGKIRRAGRLP